MNEIRRLPERQAVLDEVRSVIEKAGVPDFIDKFDVSFAARDDFSYIHVEMYYIDQVKGDVPLGQLLYEYKSSIIPLLWPVQSPEVVVIMFSRG